VLGFSREVLERIRAIPGVRSATAVTALPYAGHSSGRNFTIEGRPVDPGNVPNGMYQVAWAFARLMTSLVFGVTASDPATFVGIPLALIAAAALAIYVPARRAMRIDPIVALRYE